MGKRRKKASEPARRFLLLALFTPSFLSFAWLPFSLSFFQYNDDDDG
jgi:hypothetical protein